MRKGLGRHNYRSAGGLIPSLIFDFAGTGVLDPRVTFTRGTTAKYYDSSTVALAEQNLFLYSNTFNNAAWTATGGTVASGVTDPSGGSTAFSFTANSLNATLYQAVTLTATPYTESIWIKRVSGIGVINLTLDGVTLSPVTITGSWVKYTYTATPSAGSKTVGIQVVTIGDVINIYGSQIENRSVATATNITTTAILQNYIPQLMTAAINVARFDYYPVTRAARGLLIEQSSTNLLTYSQDFSNVAWNKARCSITASANIAPDGTQTMSLLVEDTTASNSHPTYRTITGFVSGTSYTFSAYIKSYGRTQACLAVSNTAFPVNTNVYFDINAGSIVSSTNATGTITLVGDGVYKCTLTATAGASGNGDIYIQPAVSGTTIYSGNGYSGIYIWQAQLEALNFASSPIITTSAQVTRSADTPPLPIGSWYNTSQGTWFGQVDMMSTSGTPRIVGATPSSKAPIEISNQAAAMFDNVFGVSTANTITANTTQKIAAAWTGTTGLVCLNGGTVATGSQLNGYADLTTIGIGYNSTSNDNFINGRIAKISYYPTALTSAQLQALTT